MSEILIYNNHFCYYEHTSKSKYKWSKEIYNYNYYCNKYSTDSVIQGRVSDAYYKLLTNSTIRNNTNIYEILYTHAISTFKEGIISNVVLSDKFIYLPYPLCKSYVPYNVWKALINEFGLKILEVLPAKYKNKHTGKGYELYKLAYIKDNSLINKHLTNVKIKINIKKDFNLYNSK
jgi:hypothetical protein